MEPELPSSSPLLVIQPPPSPKTAWEHTKSWFKYSETIFLARATMLSGFLIAVVGSLDWSPFTSYDFTEFKPKQLIGIGTVTLVKGAVDEIARRRNMTDATGGTVVN